MIYVVCGPTCSGKTKLACFLADKYNCKIINADAFQIYKGMDIGTAKISDPSLLSKHLLLDILTPDQEYSIKEYKKDFWDVLNKIKEKDVVVCGGSGLYIRSALYDYDFPEYTDDVSDLEEMDCESLFNLLKELDFESSTTIHQNNKKRIIHAISMARTGNRKSDVIEKQDHKLLRDDVVFIFINPDRAKLYEQINERVDEMVSKGLVDEVKTLLDKYNLSKTARAAIGYKEVIDFLEGNSSMEACVELIKQRTRNYAKRQVTYFKHQLPCKEFSNVEEAMKFYE